LLRAGTIGRIAFTSDDWPVVFPVNYRLVEASERTWIALRTRPGNVIDRSPLNVAFQVDGLGPMLEEGWSVLVRGTLHDVDPDAADFRERFDPHPVAVEQARGERQHSKSHRQSSVGRVLREISRRNKRLHKTICRRPRDAGVDRDIRHRQRVIGAGNDIENRKRLAQAFDG